MGVENQIKTFLDFLFSPVGFLALSAFVVLLVATGFIKNVRWGVLSILLYVGTLGFHDKAWLDNTLVFPLQQVRDQGRGVTSLLLMALLFPALVASRGWRIRLILGTTSSFFLLELVYAGRLISAGQVSRGAVAVLVYCLIFLVLGLGLSKWLQDLRDVRATIHAAMMMGVLFVIGTVYQLLVNASAIVDANDRLIATTSNPQKAAADIAILLPLGCYLLMCKDKRKWWWVVYSPLIGVLSIFLVWTGSRTGLLMSLVGLGLLVRRRVGRILPLVIVCGSFALFAVQVFSESTGGIRRLASTQDTRSEAWGDLIADFAASPVFGVMGENPAIQENSYLAIAARLGIMGIIPCLALMTLGTAALIKLQRFRKELGENALLADLVTAGLVSIMVGACFEGYLLGTFEFPVFCVYIYMAILAFLLDAMRMGAANDQPTDSAVYPH